MKALSFLIVISALATPAFAGSYYTVVDKPMSLSRCLRAIGAYASSKGYETKQWQQNDFYLLENGEKVGNAYYSSGRCYIYLNQ